MNKKKNLFKRFVKYIKETYFCKSLALLMLSIGYFGSVLMEDGTVMLVFILFIVLPLLMAKDKEL